MCKYIYPKIFLQALFYAVNKNKCEIVQKLVDAGIDLTLKNRYERTALDIALLKNFEEVAAILGYIDENKFMKYEALKDSVSKILDALPAPCGSGGFSCDVQDILKSLLPFKKTEEDKEKKVSLPEFLNFNENDLCDIGIPFQCDRLKVLKYTIHEYHLCPWKKSSMPQFPQDNVTYDFLISLINSSKNNN